MSKMNDSERQIRDKHDEIKRGTLGLRGCLGDMLVVIVMGYLLLFALFACYFARLIGQ